MRFYPTSEGTRLFLTVAWSFTGAVFLVALLANHHSWWNAIWILNAVIQVCSARLNFWEITPGGLVQHGLFYRRSIQFGQLQYAGPVRSDRLRRWLKRSIQLDAQTLSSPLYVSTAKRTDFLTQLHALAPQAEVVLA